MSTTSTIEKCHTLTTSIAELLAAVQAVKATR